MKRIIVTGASGLLGRHLIPLLSERDDVYAIERSGSATARENVTRVVLDLSRPIERSALPETSDAIVYLAQSDRFRDFPEGTDDMLAVNVAQVQSMLDYAYRSGARSFVYASSGGLYGTANGIVAEESPTPPPGQTLGFYPTTKLCGELLAKAYASVMNIVILRFFFIYGPGQKVDMLVPRLIGNVAAGLPIMLQGERGIRINPVHVEDAACATAAALGQEGAHVINVAGPQVLSLRDMGEIIGATLGKIPRFQIDIHAQPIDLIGDISRMAHLLCAPTRRFVDTVPELTDPRRGVKPATRV